MGRSFGSGPTELFLVTHLTRVFRAGHKQIFWRYDSNGYRYL